MGLPIFFCGTNMLILSGVFGKTRPDRFFLLRGESFGAKQVARRIRTLAAGEPVEYLYTRKIETVVCAGHRHCWDGGGSVTLFQFFLD